ncbi:hypothetical protein ABGB17_08755 [Sphaerisporangium sp. B11E5]|uniref:hypothetical protein n=1 Tax=Sphaerisporangium sp. B11E5 TaxID=3153563 RepID=UPI00325D390B
MPDETTPPASWAGVCALYDRLRQLSRDAGLHSEWRALAAAARDGTDTLDGWSSLCAAIAEQGTWYGTYVIREPGPSARYTCPARHRCSRRAAATPSGHPPRCGLADRPMVARDDA